MMISTVDMENVEEVIKTWITIFPESTCGSNGHLTSI